MRLAMPAALIRSPVRMNSGSASRPKKLRPSNRVTPMLARVKSITMLQPTTQKPITRKMGTPSTNRIVTPAVINAIRVPLSIVVS